MSGWQTALLIFVICVGVGLASWFISASVQHRRDIADWPNYRDTVTVTDTLWREVVKIRTLHQTRKETVWVNTNTNPETYDSLYVISADTANDRFYLHLEYAQPEPLGEGFFQNVQVNIRDSVKLVTVTERVVEVRTEFPIWQTIAISTAALGLGVWIGNR